MKLIHKLMLAVIFTSTASCLATSDDLRNLADEWDQAKAEYEERLENVQTQEDADEAYDDLQERLTDAVTGTAEDIEERYEEMAVVVADIGQKAASGPQGWLEILMALGGATAAGGVALNKYRNGTREKDLKNATKA